MQNNKNSSNMEEKYKPIHLENFTAVYLTTISIIQGVALAILIFNTFENINHLGGDSFKFLPYMFFSFTAIVLVIFEYMRTIDFYKWPFNLRDIIIPFVIGFLEICPMFYLTEPETWWFLTAIFMCIASIAFYNTLYISKKRGSV